MNKSGAASGTAGPEGSDALFPIRTVATLTGVNATTLRAWERRYGLITPVRTDTGHRLYTQAHIIYKVVEKRVYVFLNERPCRPRATSIRGSCLAGLEGGFRGPTV